jgi:large conductance mechanosensitive channel
MSLIQEFKTFAMRGNVLDMAVGIIIGGAFGKIVSSLVSDVLMPPLGLLLGKMDFSKLAIELKEAGVDAAGKEVPAVMLRYGQFLDNVVSFLIVAFAVFMLIKAINMAHKKEAATPAAPPAPPKQEVLLTEIRDLLAKR